MILTKNIRDYDYTAKKISLRDLEREENIKNISENVNIVNAEERKEILQEKLSKRSFLVNSNNKSRNIRLLDTFENLLDEQLTKYILSEAYIDSLYLDSYIKTESHDKLAEAFFKAFDDIDGLKLIKENELNSIYLNDVSATVKALKENIVTSRFRMINESSNNEVMPMKLTKDEVTLIEEAETALKSNDLSKLIKDKVVQVIKDETEMADTEQRDIESIQNEVEKISSNSKELKENFNSLVKVKKIIREDSLFKSIMIGVSKKYQQNVQENVVINYDDVMADSIIHYSILEFFNTTKLKQYSTNELKAISEDIKMLK